MSQRVNAFVSPVLHIKTDCCVMAATDEYGVRILKGLSVNVCIVRDNYSVTSRYQSSQYTERQSVTQCSQHSVNRKRI